jgi:two-component system chemotaxis response regulator CheY
MRVLVIDNSSEIRALLQDILLSRGYEVEIAESGEEALRMYPTLNPDVVTLDLGMPGGMDGYHTLSKIKEIDKNANVIIITAFPYEHSMKKCLEKGAAGFLHKPFSIPELLRTIQQARLYTR